MAINLASAGELLRECGDARDQRRRLERKIESMTDDLDVGVAHDVTHGRVITGHVDKVAVSQAVGGRR